MTIIEKFKRWLGLAPKPAEAAEPADTKTVELPNGRTAIVDDKGNFKGFK